MCVLQGGTSAITRVAFSPNGNHIISGSDNGAVQLWSASSGAHVGTLKRHPSYVTSVGYSPDGTIVFAFTKKFRILPFWLSNTKHRRAYCKAQATIRPIFFHVYIYISLKYMGEKVDIEIFPSCHATKQMWIYGSFVQTGLVQYGQKYEASI